MTLTEEQRLRVERDNAVDDAKNYQEQIEVMHLRRENELRQMNDMGYEIKRLQAIIDTPPEEAEWKSDLEVLDIATQSSTIDIEIAKKWHSSYRKAQNSNLLRKQENELLRASLVEHEEHENQTHVILGAILGTDDTLENVAKRAAARIKELEAENKLALLELQKSKNRNMCEERVKKDMQSERVIEARLDVIDQQAIQIKALERDSIRLASKIRELEADVLQKSLLCDSLAENCNSLKSDLADSEKRNADLRRAIDEFANSIFSQEQAARIKELEAALKSEKAWVRQYQKWLVEEVAEGMSENGFADDDLRQKARDSLILDGKIGPDADAKPREGLYGKYLILKADGSPVDPNADYFVLRLDTDPVARRAAREYSYMTVDRKLALELQERITKYNPKMMDCINLQFFGVEKPRVWQITKARKNLMRFLLSGDFDRNCTCTYCQNALKEGRAMLTEAGQCE